MSLLDRFVTRLSAPRARWFVIASAMALSLPSLLPPRVADEHIQTLRWRAAQSGGASFLDACFVFATGRAADNLDAIERAHGAWWTPLDFKVAFWRPLSALTHAIDLTLWPTSAAMMHAHTLVWFFALLLAVDALSRRLLSGHAAAVALALYAWDDARGGALSWIANRSALIACLFGVGALLAHDRWRRDGWGPGALLAPCLFALGLLSGEMALATAALLFAYALSFDGGTLRQRILSLAPYALVVAAWQAVYSTRGFGVVASGSYVHPLHEPLSFVAKLMERGPILALGQLTFLASDFWLFLPRGAKAVVFALALSLVAGVARVSWERVRSSQAARFGAIASALSLVPIASAGPGDRNLVFVGVGASVLVAEVLVACAATAPSTRAQRFVVGLLVACNLALAPLMLPLKCLANFNFDKMRAETDRAIPRDASIAARTLVVVSAPSEGGLFFTTTWRAAEGITRPGHVRLLATSLARVEVTRVDERTLRVRPAGGFLATEMQRLLRSASRAFRAGDRVTLSNMSATVVQVTGDGRPSVVEFRFASPLEGREWLWMRGQGMGLASWSPPRVGESVTVEPAM